MRQDDAERQARRERQGENERENVRQREKGWGQGMREVRKQSKQPRVCFLALSLSMPVTQDQFQNLGFLIC